MCLQISSSFTVLQRHSVMLSGFILADEIYLFSLILTKSDIFSAYNRPIFVKGTEVFSEV
jgi:hypothetical protein